MRKLYSQLLPYLDKQLKLRGSSNFVINFSIYPDNTALIGVKEKNVWSPDFLYHEGDNKENFWIDVRNQLDRFIKKKDLTLKEIWGLESKYGCLVGHR